MGDKYPSTMLVDMKGKTDPQAQSDEINKALHDLLDKINQISTIASGAAVASSVITYSKDVLYTPAFQGFGTPTGVSFSWSRAGNHIKVAGEFTSGTNTAVEARIYLPVINSVQLLSDSKFIPSIMLRGIGAWAGSNFQTIAMLIESGVGYMTLGVYNSGIGVLGKLAGNQLPSTTVFSCYFEIPISGWN